MQSDGSPWRPLVHVLDIAHAFAQALVAPREVIHNQAFNVGRVGENYRDTGRGQSRGRHRARMRGELRGQMHRPTYVTTESISARSSANFLGTSPNGRSGKVSNNSGRHSRTAE